MTDDAYVYMDTPCKNCDHLAAQHHYIREQMRHICTLCQCLSWQPDFEAGQEVLV